MNSNETTKFIKICKKYTKIFQLYLVRKFLSIKLCTMESKGRFFFSFLTLTASLSSSLTSTIESGRRLLMPRPLQKRLRRFGRQKNSTISWEILRLGVVCFQEWSRCHGDD